MSEVADRMEASPVDQWEQEQETLERASGRSWWVRAIIVLGVVVVIGAGAFYAVLRGSLARTTGEAELPGLSGPVQVTRDAVGVPTVRGSGLADVSRALGFLHAQERFFQMDLARRYAAGELSALFGPDAVAVDRRMRSFGLRAQARRTLAELPERHRALLEAYATGVNAGLEDLDVRPPEYVLLRTASQPWRPEDSILVLQQFFLGLSVNHRYEKPLGTMRAALPAPVVEFLTPDRTRFDTPVVPGSAVDSAGGYVPAPVPGPAAVDLRTDPEEPSERDIVRRFGDIGAASNAWAVVGARSAHAGALLANDPHLSLGVPNVWYRAELDWGAGAARGATAPGLPGIVIGSTDELAWGLTNAFADQTDLVVVEVDPDDPSRYRTPDGWEPFGRRIERIAVRGAEEARVEVLTTRWGPVIDEDGRGRPLALRSPVYESAGIDVDILDLPRARSVEEAVEIARRWRGPALNILLADGDGRVAWTVTGYLPRRVGFDGKVPVSWADGEVGWNGSIDASEHPTVVDPPEGVLVSANQRPAARTGGARRLSRVWAPATRANRIARLLERRRVFDERDLLEIQLDTRSIEHDPTKDLVLDIVEPDDPDTLLLRTRERVVSWNGTADADQAGFRLLEAYNEMLRERLLGSLLAPAVAADPAFHYNWPLSHEPVLRILEERPAHLLPPDRESWPEYLRALLRETVRRIAADTTTPGPGASWGAVNRAAIEHPLADAVPVVGTLLNMPRERLPGWPGVVRAQLPDYGATLRMVVSPGRSEDGLFHMPAGQSGHVLSPHYDAGHEAWVRGRPAPFGAGEARTSFTLRPAR